MQKKESYTEINLEDLVILIHEDRIIIADDKNKTIHIVKR